MCIENTGTAAAPVGAGTATASLTAEFPAGTNRTIADVETAITPTDLTPSNGTADCTAGFDATTGRFPTAVTATDAAYSQAADQTTGTTTLTTTTAITPFNRAGAVTVAYTPQSDTELAYPAEWNNLAVAQGQLRATVTYTYTPTSGGGSSLPFTGSTGGRIATLAHHTPRRHYRHAHRPAPPNEPHHTTRRQLTVIRVGISPCQRVTVGSTTRPRLPLVLAASRIVECRAFIGPADTERLQPSGSSRSGGRVVIRDVPWSRWRHAHQRQPGGRAGDGWSRSCAGDRSKESFP